MRNYLLIALSILVALVLTLLPIPDRMNWVRPAWVLMVILYWTMDLPYLVNVGIAWIAGFSVDILEGSLLGEHALAMVVITYIVNKMAYQLRMYPIVQQSLSIFVFILLYQGILYCIEGFIGSLHYSKLYWLSSLSSMFLWPWVYFLLNDYQRR